MNNKLKKILFGLGIIGIIIVISTTFLFIYTRYIQPEPTFNWLDVFRFEPQNEQLKEVTKPDIAKFQLSYCLVFEEKNCDVAVSTSSPPTIIRDEISFNASWNVPAGTTIFAPFDGEVVFLFATPQGEDNLLLNKRNGEKWESLVINTKYDFSPMVEIGQSVTKGQPLVQTTHDIELMLVFASDLESRQVYEWYSLLVDN